MSPIHLAVALRYLQARNTSSEDALGWYDKEASQAHELQGTQSNDGNNNSSGYNHSDNDKNHTVDNADSLDFSLPGGRFGPHTHLPANGVRCPRCAEQGIEQVVLPGKHCPRCGQPC